jgi:transposase-like protein
MGDGDICIHLFAGSSTLAHAVLELARREGKARRFISVQYPEEIGQDSKDAKEAYQFCQKAGLPPLISELPPVSLDIALSEKEIEMDQPGDPQVNGQDGAAAVEPVDRVGGRSPSTLSTGCASTVPGEQPPGPLAPGQRWSVARKRAVVLRLLQGASTELLSRELGLPVYKLERWRTKAEAGLEAALKEREADAADGELAAAMRRIGELSMEVELLRAKMERAPGPLVRRRRR